MLGLLFGRKFNFFDIFVMGLAAAVHDILVGLVILFVGILISVVGEHALERSTPTPS